MANPDDGALLRAQQLVGVRGWLLFFCLVLIVMQPLGFFLWLPSLIDVWPATVRPVRLVSGLLVDAIGGAIIAGYAGWVAYRLWSIHPNAVTEAQTYLFAQLIFAAASPLILTTVA